jgi:predicted nucleic-acid-binding protein
VKALDTNILARFVLSDDIEQARLAEAQLREPCFVPDTVLLEFAWLLSSRFGLTRVKVARTLRDLITLPNLTVTDFALLNWAIDRFEAGADFADMLHLSGSAPVGVFVSFEKQLAKQAGPNSPVRVERLTG